MRSSELNLCIQDRVQRMLFGPAYWTNKQRAYMAERRRQRRQRDLVEMAGQAEKDPELLKRLHCEGACAESKYVSQVYSEQRSTGVIAVCVVVPHQAEQWNQQNKLQVRF